MTAFPAFSFLLIAFVLGLLLPSLATSSNSKVSRHPASLSCGFLVKNNKAFEVETFESAMDSFIARGGPSNYDIRESIKRPEQFLAVIECLSMFQYGGNEGYGFKQLAKKLDNEELIKLNTLIVKATNTGKLTQHQLKMLLVDVYRLMHRPRSYWKAATALKGIQKAFDQIDDEHIMERITSGIYEQGILQKMSVVIRDPDHVEKFGIFIHENQKKLFASLEVAIWMSTMLLVPEIASGGANPWVDWIPKLLAPGILSLSYFIDNSFTANDRQTIIKNGLKQGIEQVRLRMKRPQLLGRSLNMVQRTFLATVISAMMVTTVPDLAREIQIQSQQAASKILSENLQNGQRLQNSVKKTPEELAAEDIQFVLKEMRENGTHEDPLSPKMQQLQQKLIDGYRKIAQSND